MKNWKKRYFRLNAVNLSYYESKQEVINIIRFSFIISQSFKVLINFR